MASRTIFPCSYLSSQNLLPSVSYCVILEIDVFSCLLFFQEALEAVVAEARAAGVYDEGVADLRASSVSLKTKPEDVAKDPATGAVTTLAQVSSVRTQSFLFHGL